MTRGGAVNTPAREAKGEIVYGGVLPAVLATKEDELPPAADTGTTLHSDRVPGVTTQRDRQGPI